MGKIENKPTWICDRCKKQHIGSEYPNGPNDAWGTLKINQDSGWDYQGCPWAPRMREPILLCGGCIEEIVSIINNPQRLKDLEHHKATTIGLWATDRPDLIDPDSIKRFNLFEIK